MNKMMLRTVPALLAALFAGSATAAAFQLWEQNASGLGVAYAGSAAVAENAATIFYNPAGMTQLEGVQLSAGVAAIKPNFTFQGVGASAAGPNGGNAGSWMALPNAYVSAKLSRDWAVGLGVSVPFGLSSEYDRGWIGEGLAIKSDIRTINFNPSLAYRVNDQLSLGLGLNYQTIDAEMTKAGVSLKGDDASWGWNAGALFTLSPAMRVGISYRSGIKHRLDGQLNGSMPVQADLKLPSTFVLSVWQQVSDRWEAMGDLSYSRWNSLRRLDVVLRDTGVQLPDSEVFNYGNDWRIAWGAAYKASDAAKLKFGIAYDRSPVNDSDRSPRTPDANTLWLTLGGQWDAGRHGKIDIGYAYLRSNDPTINRPGLTGRYNANAHIVGAQYSVGF